MKSYVLKKIVLALSVVGFGITLLIDKNNYELMKADIKEEVQNQFAERENKKES